MIHYVATGLQKIPLGNVFQNETYLSGDTEKSGRAVSSLEPRAKAMNEIELNRAFNIRHI